MRVHVQIPALAIYMRVSLTRTRILVCARAAPVLVRVLPVRCGVRSGVRRALLRKSRAPTPFIRLLKGKKRMNNKQIAAIGIDGPFDSAMAAMKEFDGWLLVLGIERWHQKTKQHKRVKPRLAAALKMAEGSYRRTFGRPWCPF